MKNPKSQFIQMTREARLNQRLKMMEMYYDGHTYRDIAAYFNCHETNSARIIKREVRKRLRSGELNEEAHSRFRNRKQPVAKPIGNSDPFTRPDGTGGPDGTSIQPE